MDIRILELRDYINSLIDAKEVTQLEISQKADVQQSTLSRFLKSKEPQNISAKFYFSLLDFVSSTHACSIVKKLQDASSKHYIKGDNRIKVPVCALSDAENLFCEDIEIVDYIYILPHYNHHDLRILQFIGDSMQPTISDGSYIGVIPVGKQLHIGKIYLVKIESVGLVTKRVYLNKEKEIILKSDNPAHEDIILAHDNYKDIIIGKVMWVWQIV